MSKWEYAFVLAQMGTGRIVSINGGTPSPDDPENFYALVAQLGLLGWELVSSTPIEENGKPHLISASFKRAISI